MLGGINCYLLQAEKSILIDAGMPGQKRRFIRELGKTGVPFGEIKMALITHGHTDHIGMANWVKEKLDAKLAIHYQEREWLESGKSPVPPGRTFLGKVISTIGRFSPELYVKPTKADILIGDEGISLYEYGIPGKVIHTPGHTRGSTCVLLKTGEAFVGDLAMGPRFMRPRPSLSFFAEDADLLVDSLRNLFSMGLKTIFPAHGKPVSAAVFMDNFRGSIW